MSQHTQGEWRLAVINQTDGETIIYTGESTDNPDTIICEVAGGLGFDGDRCQESEANARLIAAAPKLLEAARLADQLCRLITKWADAERDDADDIMTDIVALAQDETQPSEAIAEAEGRAA